MQITTEGHSCFKLKGKQMTVVMDPFSEEIGLPFAKTSADIVTISHGHSDHSDLTKIIGTTAHSEPLVIRHAGEYESGGVSVFGVRSWHDDQEGALRGDNIIFTVFIDGVSVCHLGDLGAELTPEQIAEIGEVDVLLVPVSGCATINQRQAIETIKALNPSYAIPMHYRTEMHNPEMFAKFGTLEDFLNEYGMSPKPITKLEVDPTRFPEETELVILEKEVK